MKWNRLSIDILEQLIQYEGCKNRMAFELCLMAEYMNPKDLY